MLCDEVHEHGALAGIELTHSGGHAETRQSRWPAIGPSQLASDYDPIHVPKAMERADFERVRRDWVWAAQQARSAGFDIVYVYGGHTYLLTQFLSPYYNHRTDEYGGSLENRARLWLEMLEDVREAVGDECAIAVRIGVDLTPGLVVDEALEFIRLADHLVDLWDVNVGSIAEWSKDSGASRFYAEGWQLEWTGRVREATAKPIVGVARLTNPDRMAEIVRSRRLGSDRCRAAVDLRPVPAAQDRGGRATARSASASAATSASRSPRTVTTSAAPRTRPRARSTAAVGIRSGSTRPRTPTGTCWSSERAPPGWSARSCSASAASAACTSSRRRPRSAAGLRWVPKLPGLGEWARVVNWRRIQLEKLGNVEVITGVRLSAQDVLEYGAELVVVATGVALGERRPERRHARAGARRRRVPTARAHA